MRLLQRRVRDQLAAPLAETLNGHPSADPLVLTIDRGETGIAVTAVQDPNTAQKPTLDTVGTTLGEALEWVADGRRALYQVAEGPFVLQLQNRWDHQQRKRRQEGEASFWATVGREYHDLEGLRQRQDHLATAVGELEETGLLALLDQGPLPQALLSTLARWQEDFLVYQGQLLNFIAPDTGRLTVGLYGPLPYLGEMIDLYVSWLPEGWASVAKARWVWRDGDTGYCYGEERDRRPRRLSSQGVLVGFEGHFVGPAVQLHVETEAGRHHWQRIPGGQKAPSRRSRLYHPPRRPPTQVHRKPVAPPGLSPGGGQLQRF